MKNEVTKLLLSLQSGDMTLDEVAQQFRQRRWPRRNLAQNENSSDMAARELMDPDPYFPGSYDDVAAAYNQNKITSDQFRTLSEAIAEAQRAEDAGEI
jgi:hypothetical protein